MIGFWENVPPIVELVHELTHELSALKKPMEEHAMGSLRKLKSVRTEYANVCSLVVFKFMQVLHVYILYLIVISTNISYRRV